MSDISNEIINSLKEKNNSSRDLNNILSQPTVRDLMLFKEDILKELRIYKTKITNSINTEFAKYSGILEKAEQKLSYYENDKKGFMSRMDFIQEKEKLFFEFQNKTGKLINDVMINKLHISGCRKDIDNSIYKYDKIISENLLVPGLIGTSCKFQNLKEYILNNKEEVNNAFSSHRLNNNEINLLKRKIETNVGQLNTKVKSLEYRFSNYMTSKYHELDDKFDRLYEELNKNMNSLKHSINSNLEERNNEIVKLKNFVFEENNKALENVKAVKNEMINEFNLMKTNFKKIKKNIVSLTNLLMGRTHNMNKQLVINNFKEMMLDLFKEFSSELKLNNVEKKNEDVIPNKAYPRLSINSCIKEYIEGKISVNDTKFHLDKRALMPKRSVQLNPKMLIDFNKDKAKNNVNNNSRNNDNDNLNKKYVKKLSLVIMSPSINYFKRRSFSEQKKQRHEIDNDESRNESKNKNINIHKGINKDDIIDEEDSNKYSSKSSINSNSSQEKNKKNEKHHSINRTKTFAFNTNYMKKFEKKHESIINTKKNKNNSPKKEEKNNEYSENSSSSDSISSKSLKKMEESPEISKKKNLKINKNYDETSYRKAYSQDIKIVNNYNFNKIIKNSEKKEKKNKDYNNNNFKEIILNSFKTQKIINFNITNNMTNKVGDNLSINKKNNFTQNIKKESNNNFSFLSKIKVDLKKNFIIPKLKNNIFKNDNIIFNNNFIKTQYNGFQINSSKTIAYTERSNSPTVNRIKKHKENKITISTTNDYTNTSKNSNYINKALPSINKDSFANITSRNQNLNTDKRGKLALTDKPKYNTNKLRNKSSNNNEVFQVQKLNKRIKLLEEKLSNKSHFNNDNDIYFSKEDAKNTRYVKDDDIIDRPLLYDINFLKVEQKKGNIEDKLMELEHFTKKKFDELVKEIKIFIPIHFNSYVKN